MRPEFWFANSFVDLFLLVCLLKKRQKEYVFFVELEGRRDLWIVLRLFEEVRMDLGVYLFFKTSRKERRNSRF